MLIRSAPPHLSVRKFNLMDQVVKRCTWEIQVQEDANIFKLLNKRSVLICA